MAKHTEAEMEQMSLEDLKKNAETDTEESNLFNAANVLNAAFKGEIKPAEQQEEEEVFVARRELDLGDGAGMEVFEAEGDTKEAALEALADKIADAKLNATKKIREQEAQLKDFRARTSEPPKPKEITDDEEYIYSQELQKKPLATLKKMWKELTGYEVEDFVTAKQAADAVNMAQRNNQAINTFIATHPDYEDDPKAGGDKNGQLMKMKLAEMGLPCTSENLSKAYSHLKQSGLLVIKGEKAESGADDKAKETERIVQTKVEATPRVTKKSSGISTHSRATAVPTNVEPSEDEISKMSPEKLRELANKQLSGQIAAPSWAR